MNPYSHIYDQRWNDGDPTSIENLDIAREGVDYVAWIIEHGLGMDAEGRFGTNLVFDTGLPTHGLITLKWWEAGDGSLWLLGKTNQDGDFDRNDAQFYLRIGGIGDVPTT